MKKRFTPESMKRLCYVTWPAVSGDGSRIAYVSYTAKEADGSFPSRIHCMTKDGRELWQSGEDGSSARQPQFLPDGVRITYLSDQTGEYQVFVKNLETGEARQVTTLRHGVERYSVTGDGTRLVFEAVLWPEEIEDGCAFLEMDAREKKRWQEELDYRPYYITDLVYKMDEWHGMRKGEFSHIGTVNLDGSGQRLVDTGTMEAVYPAWSRSGELLAFYGYPYGGAKGRDAELFMCRADGSGVRQLTRDAGLCADHCPVFTAEDRAVIGMAYPDFGDGSCILVPFVVHLEEPENSGQRLEPENNGQQLESENTGLQLKPGRAGLMYEQWDEDVCHGVNPMMAGRLEYGEKRPYFALSPDGSELYFISGFHGRTGLYRVQLPQELTRESGGVKPVLSGEVLCGTEGDRDGLSECEAAENGRMKAGDGALSGCAAADDDLEHQDGSVQRTEPASGKPRIELVCPGATDLQEFAMDGQGHLVTVMATWTEPAELYLDGEKLTDSNPWLKEYELAPVEEHWITSKDGKTKLQYFLVRPVAGAGCGDAIDTAGTDGRSIRPGTGADGRSTLYPAVLDIKGGPQTMYGLAFWHEFQALAGAGIAVIYGNPRGSVGFGRAFCAGGVCWKQEAVDDLLAMVDDAVSQGWIDPKRIGVTGGSYGGYMTNKLIGRTDVFAAAVTQRCLANTATSYGTGDMGFVSAGEIPKDFRMLDYLTDRARGNIISYIDHFKIPLLILHAYEDYRCSFEQAEQVFVAMKERNPEVPVRLVMFPGENHGMTRTGKLHHQIRHLQELVDWFVKYLAEDRIVPAGRDDSEAESVPAGGTEKADKTDKDGEKHE